MTPFYWLLLGLGAIVIVLTVSAAWFLSTIIELQDQIDQERDV